tara:strand:- start:38 stop:2296 length:2259 start_codon:yes stop_codon:yes gene_type:complete
MASKLETKLKVKQIINDDEIKDELLDPNNPNSITVRQDIINKVIEQSGHTEQDIINFELDETTGAPIADRARIGFSPNYDSSLATMQEKYPGTVRYNNTNFAYPDPKDPNRGVVFNPPGFDMGDLAQHLPKPIIKTATNIAGATYGGRIAGTGYKGFKMATGAATGESAGGELTDTIFKATGGIVDRSVAEHATSRAFDFGIGAVSEVASPYVLKVLKSPFVGLSRAAKSRTVTNLNLYWKANVKPRSMSLITGNNWTKDLSKSYEYLMSNLPGSRQIIVSNGLKMFEDLSNNIVRISNRLNPRSGKLYLKPTFKADGIVKKGAENAITKWRTESKKLYDTYFDNLTNKVGSKFTIKRMPSFLKVLNELGQNTGTLIKKDVTENIYGGAPRIKVPGTKIFTTGSKPIIDTKVVGTVPTGARKQGTLDYPAINNIKEEILQKIKDNDLLITDLKQYRTLIGKHIGGKGNKIDVELGDLKQLYASLSDDIWRISDNIDPKLARQWTNASNYYKAGRKRIEDIYDKIRDVQYGKMIDFLETNSRISGQYVKSLKQNLTTPQFSLVQRELIERLGRRPITQRTTMGETITDTFDPTTFFNNYKKMSDQAKKYIFDSPLSKNMADDLNVIADMSVQFKASSVYKDPIKSGETLVGQLAMVGGIVTGTGGVVGGITGALVGLGGLITTAVGLASVGVVYTNPAVVRWLATASRIAAEGNVDKFFKLMGKAGVVFAGESAEVQKVVLDFSKSFIEQDKK